MRQQLPTISRPRSNPLLPFSFLPYDHILIVTSVSLDAARQHFQTFIAAQPQPKPFDMLFVGFPGSPNRPYYRGTFEDDHILISGPYGYRTWEWNIDGHLSSTQFGTSLDVVIRLGGLVGYLVLVFLFLCVPVVLGALTSWWFGTAALAIVLGWNSIALAFLQDALERERDLLINLLSSEPQLMSEAHRKLKQAKQ